MLVPYILWTLIYVTLNNLRSLTQIPVDFIKAVITGGGAAIMYYIFVYCAFTVLIPLIHKLACSRFKYLGFLIAPVEVLLLRTLPTLLGIQLHDYVQLVLKLSFVGWFGYFYLGYLLGNGLLTISHKSRTLWIWLGISVLLQMAEGYLLHSLGSNDAGTQLKLSTLLTCSIFLVLCYRYLRKEVPCRFRLPALLGDYSFGIYFSHLALMRLLRLIPFYNSLYPINGLLALTVSFLLCFVLRKLLRKHSWVIAA